MAMSLLGGLLQEAAQAPPVTGALETFRSLGLAPVLRALVIVLAGVPLAFIASRWTRRWVSGQAGLQAGLVSGTVVFYGALGVIVFSTLGELGFSLAPLLGAAGVLGIALGFASQTSVSNLISGMFLIAERPFVVGDLVEVGGVTGRVLSIDSLSVKLRTFDNRMVRIPNETLVKSQMTNITRFPIRRVDVRVGVAYKEDPARVREVLLDIAAKNPVSLMEPEPVVVFEGFGESALNFLLGVWGTQQNFLTLKNGIQELVKERFDAEGIEIAFPHRTLYVGSTTDAFPVQIVEPPADMEAGTEPDERT